MHARIETAQYHSNALCKTVIESIAIGIRAHMYMSQLVGFVLAVVFTRLPARGLSSAAALKLNL